MGDLEIPLTDVSLEPEVVAREEAVAEEVPVADEEPVSAEEVAWRKTPRPEESPFVTRTMAELYAKQGYREAALDVYRQLAIQHPEDSDITDRIKELSGPAESPAAEPAAEVVSQPEVVPEPLAADAWPEAETGYEPMIPSNEDLNAEIPEETPGFTGRHFTETELSDTGTFERIELDSESPFGELAWEPEPFLEGEFSAAGAPPADALTEDMVTELTP
ncbi:MAG TPA: hypothetical protein VFX40_02025, partial [Gemmatimonadaceae bacterium]|nr:hypothetical protein [Gemmatimonadaceae bacterium]